MILFYEDWYKYPNAIVHDNTTNKSWIRLAGVYKKMGIKNHAFHLSLLNPNLKEIDPRSDNLTDELKEEILTECYLNPWYYFREVLRVPPPAGALPLQFRANRANIASLWLAFNHITFLLIQPRQTGKSLTGDSLDGYMLNIRAYNTNLSLLTKDDSLRSKTSAKIKELIELLPEYLVFLNKKDIKNNEKLTVKLRKNVLNLYVGQKDKKAADNIGRGMTTPIVRIDEFAYIYNNYITLPVILAATTTAREIAEQLGSPYYTIFTTTPGKLNTKEGQFAYNIYKDSLRWNEKFFDFKNREELEDYVNKNTRRFKIVLLEFNHRQLGFTDKWLSDRLQTALSDGEDAESDFLNKWVGGNTKSPIPKQYLEIIINSKINDYRIENYKYGYILKWFINKQDLAKTMINSNLIIGVDTSDAIGENSDYIGLVIRESKTGAVVAAGKYNETNLTMFSEFLVQLLKELPNSVMIIERKSSATAILDNMFTFMYEENMNPFKRLFNLLVQKKEEYPEINKLIKLSRVDLYTLAKYKRRFGYTTSGSGEMSRGILYGNVFKTSYTYTANTVHDPDLIDQLASLVYVNGRIDHPDGGHDDLVVAWLLNMYFLLYGRNKDMYGINTDGVLDSLVNNELLTGLNIDKKKILEQEKIKSNIEELVKELKVVQSEALAEVILNKIRKLQDKLDPNIIKSFNLDSMLKEIKMYKRIEARKKYKNRWY